MRKKKKSSVVVDAPRSSKPIAVALSSLAFAGGCAILFNAFFNQAPTTQAQLVAGIDAKTRVTVVANQKTSRTITLKYDALVEDVQRELLSTGHFNGLVDGVTGPKTVVAVEAYQRENKLDLTGEVTPRLLEHIRYTRKLNQAAEFTGSLSPQPSVTKANIQPLAQLPKPTKMVAAKAVDNAVSKIQQRLALLGYDPGSRSGQLDEGTRSAILIFEMDHGIPMEGKISKALLGALKTAETKKKN